MVIHPKISAAAFAGALVTVVLGIIAAAGVTWSPDPAWVAALTTLVAIAAGWLIPSRLSHPDDADWLADAPPERPTDTTATPPIRPEE